MWELRVHQAAFVDLCKQRTLVVVVKVVEGVGRVEGVG
jgi:hypothetical protein